MKNPSFKRLFDWIYVEMAEKNEVVLCKYLLEKYADIINDREKRTIGEIKSLVDGTDLSIQSFIADFKDSAYSFEADYEKSLKRAIFLKDTLNIDAYPFEVSTPSPLAANPLLGEPASLRREGVGLSD